MLGFNLSRYVDCIKCPITYLKPKGEISKGTLVVGPPLFNYVKKWRSDKGIKGDAPWVGASNSFSVKNASLINDRAYNSVLPIDATTIVYWAFAAFAYLGVINEPWVWHMAAGYETLPNVRCPSTWAFREANSHVLALILCWGVIRPDF